MQVVIDADPRDAIDRQIPLRKGGDRLVVHDEVNGIGRDMYRD